MSDDQIDDLKQFIATTIAQQVSSHTEELREEIRTLDTNLSKKIDDLSQSVAEALDNSNGENAKRLDTHERRLAKLEVRAV